MYLEQINQVNDIKKLDKNEWNALAQEIREFLIEKISVTGGHLASNLGVVELTMAMHLAFDFPQDKVVWDVGHQSYTHKLLTGRKAGFDELRKYGGMSGFPKRKESDCDCFDTGHSSTSISAGIGLVKARDLLGGNYSVISVIGDGALTGGMAFEALNNASQLKSNFIIVLNDNQMSIAENVGGISQYLNGLRSAEGYNNFKEGLQNTLEKIPVYGEGLVRQLKKTKSGLKQLVIPGMFFENMGITYLGPVDGHNMDQLIRAFNDAKKIRHAVLLHVCTKKGKGYAPAERHPSRFHGAEPFEIETGLDGLVHISEVANKRVSNIADELEIGQAVEAKILEIDTERKRISLSLKQVDKAEDAEEEYSEPYEAEEEPAVMDEEGPADTAGEAPEAAENDQQAEE